MVLKSWSFAFMLFMIMLFSGVVDSIDVISPQDPMENAMSTTPIVYDNVEGSSDVSLGLVTGPTGSNGPKIEDLLPDHNSGIKVSESGTLQVSPTIGEQMKDLLSEIPEGNRPIMGVNEDGNLFYSNDHFIIPPGAQTDNAFKIYVIGDSIAWGNGLYTQDKYYYQVAEDLQKSLNGRPVEVIVYAHSGAVISGESDTLELQKNADLNSGFPSLMEQAKSISNDADLILVSGGINDVEIGNIVDTTVSADKIRSRSESIQKPMENLLTYLLDNTKPSTKVVVTGYYPLVSTDTEMDLNVKVASIALQPKNGINSLSPEYNEKLIENSKAFYDGSTTGLRNAVENVNKDRIVFAVPDFQPENSYGASETWLWELIWLLPPIANDDQFKTRQSEITNLFDVNSVNSISHPNKDGASEYARVIESSIGSKGPGWLTSTAPANTGIPKSLLKKEFLASLKTPMLSPTSGISWVSDQNKAGTDGLETSGATYSDKANDVWYVDAFYWSGDRNLLEKPAAPYRFASGEINTYGYNWIFLPYSQTGIRFSPGYADWAADTLASMGISVGAGVGPLDDGQVGGGLGGGGGESW